MAKKKAPKFPEEILVVMDFDQNVVIEDPAEWLGRGDTETFGIYKLVGTRKLKLNVEVTEVK